MTVNSYSAYLAARLAENICSSRYFSMHVLCLTCIVIEMNKRKQNGLESECLVYQLTRGIISVR